MAKRQFSKSDNESQRDRPESDADKVTWRDWVIDISGLCVDIEEELKVPLKDREVRTFTTEEEFEAFWKMCDEIAGPGREPDWEEHLQAINKARIRGLPEI